MGEMINFTLEEINQVAIQTEAGWATMQHHEEGRWSGGGAELAVSTGRQASTLELEAPETSVLRIKLRWNCRPSGRLLVLGDHWERGYGDLEWRGIVPERVMSWYFMAHDGKRTFGAGMKTGANAFGYWQLDTEGVTFTADVTSGGQGVMLGRRKLTVAELIAFKGDDGESAFSAARRFCSMMCERPVLPPQPVYGGNNWYYAYGNSTHREVVEDSKFMSSLSAHASNRPFMVIDDGWQLASGGGACNGGPWQGNRLFPDMAGLAGEMKEIGVKPGIWCRPLLTSEEVPAEWVRYQVGGGQVLDPSVPDVLQYVRESVERMSGWGYDLIKHDFTTFDLLGQWGFQMKSRPNALPHGFRDRSRTTAEITLALYRTIAEASGSSLLIGCNTFSHLSAGLFEIQRTGDDTSGKWWERTRYMGVNTLAFRMPQHGTFYSHDADCIGITTDVPWSMNRQWLELLAASGTPLFVSADPKIVTREQEAELRAAFELAADPLPPGEPLDWMDTTCPRRWLLDGTEVEYSFNGISEQLLEEKDNGWWL
jgi:alpha-galactosidase